jgi:Concanavalin A-like lectin/glucanases superfamily
VQKGRVLSLVCVVMIATVLLCASAASAATLVGDYQFQGTRASSGPGPALTDVGAGGPTAFQTDSVMGTTRQVLAFPEGTGLSMTPSVGSGDIPYSVVTTFRFTDLDGYRRILDPSEGSADQGFYQYSGAADIYGNLNEGYTGTIVFNSNTYGTVALTSSPASESRFYVNGTLAVNLNETFPVVDDTLRFFKDDGSEDSAGALSCIRVYSGVLTDAEIAAIGASPTCQVPMAPTPHKKKCKKHKKKHRAADAKKKCKKKKKKRR